MTFQAVAKCFDLSTKAEALAKLTTLRACSEGCNVFIYTDSQCCIDTFAKLSSPSTSPQRILKLDSYLIWTAIEHGRLLLVLASNLSVKSHNGVYYNDIANRTSMTNITQYPSNPFCYGIGGLEDSSN